MGRENRAMLFDLISDPHGRRRVPYPSLLRPRPRSSLENAPRDDLCIFDAPLPAQPDSVQAKSNPTDRPTSTTDQSVGQAQICGLLDFEFRL